MSWSRIQISSVGVNSGGTATATFGSSVAAGDLVVVFASNGAGQTPPTPKDNINSIGYTQYGVVSNGNQRNVIWYYVPPVGGTGFTVSISGDAYQSIIAVEYSAGAGATYATDGSVKTATGTGTTASTASITPAGNDLIVSATVQNSNFSGVAAGSGFYLLGGNASNGSGIVLETEDALNQSSGITPSMSWTNSATWAMIAGAFTATLPGFVLPVVGQHPAISRVGRGRRSLLSWIGPSSGLTVASVWPYKYPSRRAATQSPRLFWPGSSSGLAGSPARPLGYPPRRAVAPRPLSLPPSAAILPCYLYDTFGGNAGTSLSAHTGDSGATWPGATGFTLDGNGWIYNTTTAFNTSTATMPPTDAFTIQYDLSYVSAISGLYVGLVTNNGGSYIWFAYKQGSGFAWWNTATAETSYVAIPGFSTGNTYRIRLDVHPNGSNTVFSAFYSTNQGATWTAFGNDYTLATSSVPAPSVGPYFSGANQTQATGVHLGRLLVQSLPATPLVVGRGRPTPPRVFRGKVTWGTTSARTPSVTPNVASPKPRGQSGARERQLASFIPGPTIIAAPVGQPRRTQIASGRTQQRRPAIVCSGSVLAARPVGEIRRTRITSGRAQQRRPAIVCSGPVLAARPVGEIRRTRITSGRAQQRRPAIVCSGPVLAARPVGEIRRPRTTSGRAQQRRPAIVCSGPVLAARPVGEIRRPRTTSGRAQQRRPAIVCSGTTIARPPIRQFRRQATAAARSRFPILPTPSRTSLGMPIVGKLRANPRVVFRGKAAWATTAGRTSLGMPIVGKLRANPRVVFRGKAAWATTAGRTTLVALALRPHLRRLPRRVRSFVGWTCSTVSPPLNLPSGFTAILIVASNVNPFSIDPGQTLVIVTNSATDPFVVAPGQTSLILQGNVSPWGIDPEQTTCQLQIVVSPYSPGVELVTPVVGQARKPARLVSRPWHPALCSTVHLGSAPLTGPTLGQSRKPARVVSKPWHPALCMTVHLVSAPIVAPVGSQSRKPAHVAPTPWHPTFFSSVHLVGASIVTPVVGKYPKPMKVPSYPRLRFLAGEPEYVITGSYFNMMGMF